MKCGLFRFDLEDNNLVVTLCKSSRDHNCSCQIILNTAFRKLNVMERTRNVAFYS